jgi:hypothetical protein
MAYVSNAVPSGDGKQGLQPLGVAGEVERISLTAKYPIVAGDAGSENPTSVALFDQGLTQVLEASVSGLQPRAPYVLALADSRDGNSRLQALSAFSTNPAGSAIVNAVGPIRQLIKDTNTAPRRYLVIATGTPDHLGNVVQWQLP